MVVHQQQLLIDEFNKIAIDILCKQRDYERLNRYIADVRIAYKTGSLDTVCHDAGATMDFLIGVFLRELHDFEFEKRFIGRISKIVYDYFK